MSLGGRARENWLRAQHFDAAGSLRMTTTHATVHSLWVELAASHRVGRGHAVVTRNGFDSPCQRVDMSIEPTYAQVGLLCRALNPEVRA